MKYIKVQKLAMEMEKKNKILAAEAAKSTANIDYIAMMTDVDLPNEETEADANV